MRIIGVGEFRKQAPALLEAVRRRGEALLLTKHGHPCGIVLPLDGDEWEDFVLAYHPQLQAEWEQARRQVARGEYVTLRQLRSCVKEK
jgi:PHD/YefM family antitoxin component YafN of YafNO toxin-antitoxin module